MINGAQKAWSAQGKNVMAMLKQEFNLTGADLFALAHFWAKKKVKDTSLSKREDELTAAAKLKYMAR